LKKILKLNKMSYLKISAISLLIWFSFTFPDSVFANTIISNSLQHKLSNTRSDEQVRINIRFEEQYDSSLLQEKLSSLPDPEFRRKYVVNELKSFSMESQKDLINYLSGKQKSNMVSEIRPLWIVNLINCYATKDVIEQIAKLPGIAKIDYDQEQQVIDPDFYNELTVIEADKLQEKSSIAWHVNHINAPEVWQQGYTGENIVVAVLDSGVNYNHQDLAGNMWTHPDYPYHGYNFIENNNNPMDYFFHGTHVAGIVAGNGTAGTTTGVAPGTTIMAVKVLSNNGGGTQWGVWAGIQFAVEHGAHILNLSLGWSYSWSPDRGAWRTSMVNALNAGVIAAVAAGNEGSINNQPNNVRTPGDCPSPWKHPDQSPTGGSSAAVTVGSTMVSDIISGFSSRGPVTWNNISPFNDYPLNPGMGLIAPDVVAPGSDILSLSNSNNAGYFVQNGTSMATPAVAGVMALMLSKNPGLSMVQMNKIIEESAVKLTPTKSNIYGSGRLDALAAIESTPYLGVQYYSHFINDSLGNNDGKVNPGEIIHISLEMENKAAVSYNDVVLNISSNSQHLILLDSMVSLGDFEAEEIKLIENIFRFQALETLPGNYEIGFMLQANSSGNEEEFWLSGFSESSHGPYIEVLEAEIDDSQYGNNNGKLEPGEWVTVILPLKNSGQVKSSPVTITANLNSPWVYVLSENTFHTDPIEADDTTELELQIGVLTDAPMGTAFDLVFSIESGYHAFEWYQTLIIGKPFVFTSGPIPTTLHTNPNTNTLAIEPGTFTVTIPEGATITGVDVSYDIISHNGGWISDQRSYLRCISEGGTKENVITPGSSTSDEGRESYFRSGLDIANGVTGNEISFELHAFRLWGGTGSNINFAFVADSTWKINVQYQLPKHEHTFRIINQNGELIENASFEVAGEVYYTDNNGEVSLMIARGCHLVNVSAHKHAPLTSHFVHVWENQVTEIVLERLQGVVFNISDPSGNTINHASIFLNGEPMDGSDMYGLEDGFYSYLITADGFARVNGNFEMNNQDVSVYEVMFPAFDVTFNITDQWGDLIADAIITINDQSYEQGFYEFIELFPGFYNFSIEAPDFNPYSDSFEITNSHLLLDIEMISYGTFTDEVLPPSFKIYPIPAKGRVFAEFKSLPETNYSIALINHLGQVILKMDLDQQCINLCLIEIDIEGLPSGLYTITINNGKKRFHEKLIIQ
jgi:hypothetical protein